jgi:hypothetical protein
MSAGTKEVPFNASKLPSGVYFARLQSGSNVDMKKNGFVEINKRGFFSHEGLSILSANPFFCLSGYGRWSDLDNFVRECGEERKSIKKPCPDGQGFLL